MEAITHHVYLLQLSVSSKKLLNDMQLLSDKGCREMNKMMRKAASPSMPYIGLYLQVPGNSVIAGLWRLISNMLFVSRVSSV